MGRDRHFECGKLWDDVGRDGVLVAGRNVDNLCCAFRIVCGITQLKCLLKKRRGVSVDNDGGVGFEIVNRSSDRYGIVVEHGRGHGDVAQMRRIRFGYGFGSLDDRWSYDWPSTLVWRDLSIEVDDVDDQR